MLCVAMDRASSPKLVALLEVWNVVYGTAWVCCLAPRGWELVAEGNVDMREEVACGPADVLHAGRQTPARPIGRS